MSILRKIADWIDPSRAQEIVDTKASLDFHRDAVNEMSETIEARAKSVDDMADKLSAAATQINRLRDANKALSSALFIARAYAMDAYDDEEATLSKLGTKSTKRPMQLALVEAIKSDLKQIVNALVAGDQ